MERDAIGTIEHYFANDLGRGESVPFHLEKLFNDLETIRTTNAQEGADLAASIARYSNDVNALSLRITDLEKQILAVPEELANSDAAGFTTARFEAWDTLLSRNLSTVEELNEVSEEIRNRREALNVLLSNSTHAAEQVQVCEVFTSVNRNTLGAEIEAVTADSLVGLDEQALQQRSLKLAAIGGGLGVLLVIILWPMIGWTLGNIERGGGIVSVVIFTAFFAGASLYGFSRESGWAWVGAAILGMIMIVYFAPLLIIGAGAAVGWGYAHGDLEKFRSAMKKGKIQARQEVENVGARLIGECQDSLSEEYTPDTYQTMVESFESLRERNRVARMTLVERQLVLEPLAKRIIGSSVSMAENGATL